MITTIEAGETLNLTDEKGRFRSHRVGKPIVIFAKDVEDGAMLQLVEASHHPCLYHHVAAMPDVHQGYGLPIGGVVAFHDGVSPYCVGKDIGCGMHAIRTDIPSSKISREDIIKIRRAIRRIVPMGGGKAHPEPKEWKGFSKYLGEIRGQELSFATGIASKKWRWIQRCLGTLGGGNHFIEIQEGDGFIWFMIHSGSRNLGEMVCNFHHNIALEHNLRWKTDLPSERLAFLPTGTKLCDAYLRDMKFALDFARQNRLEMMGDVLKAARDVLGYFAVDWARDVHHNYATLENHFGKNVWVHRKGATSAKEGEWGIIPGDQGSPSYIVKGKGNIHSFMSCPHGAGRAFGRNDACRNLDPEEEIKKLGDVVCDSWGTRFMKVDGKKVEMPDLGEAPGAYKDISVVMEHARELCDIEVELRPLGNLKGDDSAFKRGKERK